MFKMLRVLRHNETLSTFIELLQVNPTASRLLKLVIVYFLYPVHIMACVWFYVASFNRDPNSWAEGVGLFQDPWNMQYLVSFYWSMQTITTVGFGDISIGLLEEYLFALLWMAFGVSTASFYAVTHVVLVTQLGADSTLHMHRSCPCNASVTAPDAAKYRIS